MVLLNHLWGKMSTLAHCRTYAEWLRYHIHTLCSNSHPSYLFDSILTAPIGNELAIWMIVQQAN